MVQFETLKGKLVKIGTRVKTSSLTLKHNDNGDLIGVKVILRVRMPKGFTFDDPYHRLEGNKVVIQIKGNSFDIHRSGRSPQKLKIDYPLENFKQILVDDEVIKYRMRFVFSIYFIDKEIYVNPETSAESILVGI